MNVKWKNKQFGGKTTSLETNYRGTEISTLWSQSVLFVFKWDLFIDEFKTCCILLNCKVSVQ